MNIIDTNLPRLLGGEPRLHGGGPPLRMGGGPPNGRGFGNRTAVALTSCPSICPPSMYLMAFSASSDFSNSTYAKPRVKCG